MKLQIAEHGSARMGWDTKTGYSLSVSCYAVFVEDAVTEEMIPFIVATKNEGIIERLETATGLEFEKLNRFDWSLLSDTRYTTTKELETEDCVVRQISHEIAQMQFDHYNQLVSVNENPLYNGNDSRLPILDEISVEMNSLVDSAYNVIDECTEAEYKGWYYDDNGNFQLYQDDE